MKVNEDEEKRLDSGQSDRTVYYEQSKYVQRFTKKMNQLGIEHNL